MESFASKFSLGRGGLLPQEEMLEINNKKQQLRIGVLKESDTNEHRIALTPQAVELLHANGYSVFFERGAGLGALFSDQEYSEAGAEIKDTKEEVYEADVLLKVAPFSQKDIQLLKEHQIVLSSFLINDKAKQNVQDLLSKKVTAIGFEYIRDFEGNYPVVASMQEIAGSMSILIAAQCLS